MLTKTFFIFVTACLYVAGTLMTGFALFSVKESGLEVSLDLSKQLVVVWVLTLVVG